MTTDRALGRWARDLARSLGAAHDALVNPLPASSGAALLRVGTLVVKVHHPRTDAAVLAVRLALAVESGQFVPPTAPRVHIAPDGRPATVWPWAPGTDPAATTQPWAAAGTLLAGLHRRLRRTPAAASGTATLPGHGWPARLARAAARAPVHLRGLGVRLVRESDGPEPGGVLLHGDWHLGQLGRWTDGWRLLDIDDVGVGDPAWDLARPAGFWACGLLDDSDWATFLDAYRAGGGPAVPASGDPWPVLDRAARVAVFVAAVRAARAPAAHSRRTARTLLVACRRMAQ